MGGRDEGKSMGLAERKKEKNTKIRYDKIRGGTEGQGGARGSGGVNFGVDKSREPESKKRKAIDYLSHSLKQERGNWAAST